MKNTFRFLLLLCVGLQLAIFTGCSSDDEIDVQELELRGDTDVTVSVGGTAGIMIKNGNGGYTATSSDNNIAEVEFNDPQITIIGKVEGSATITVKDSKGKEVAINVTVTRSIQQLVLSVEESLGIIIGNTQEIQILKGNGDYKLEVLDENIATASLNGVTITITSKNKGDTKLIVSDREGQSATINIYITEKPLPKAVYLGENNFIKVPFASKYAKENTALTSMKFLTMEALVRIDNQVFLNTIMGWEGNFLIRQNQNKFNISCGNNIEILSDEIQYGKWYHIAVVFDGGQQNVKLYINGEPKESVSVNVTSKDLSLVLVGDDAYRDFFFGSASDGNRRLAGSVGEARIWSTARTANEIKDNMMSVDPSTAGLLAYWKLNETTTGTEIKDLSGHNYHGQASVNINKWTDIVFP